MKNTMRKAMTMGMAITMLGGATAFASSPMRPTEDIAAYEAFLDELAKDPANENVDAFAAYQQMMGMQVVQISQEGTIGAITTTEDGTEIFVENDNGGLRVMISDMTKVLNAEDGNYMFAEELEEGMTVTIAYPSNAPMGMSLPPFLGQPTAVIANTDATNVAVGLFDEAFFNEDEMLILNVDETTEIAYLNGNRKIATADDIAGNNAIVFYGMSTRSLPAQTTPTKVLIIEAEDVIMPGDGVSGNMMELSEERPVAQLDMTGITVPTPVISYVDGEIDGEALDYSIMDMMELSEEKPVAELDMIGIEVGIPTIEYVGGDIALDEDVYLSAEEGEYLASEAMAITVEIGTAGEDGVMSLVEFEQIGGIPADLYDYGVMGLPEFAEEMAVSYMTETGVVADIEAVDGGFRVFVENETGGLNFILAEGDRILNAVDGADLEAIEEGMTITVMYDTATPVGMSFPMFIGNVTGIIANTDEAMVTVGQFNEDFLNEEAMLKLNISEDTEITSFNNNRMLVTEENVKNANAIVFYNMTTMSIPAQTTPSKIVLLPETVTVAMPVAELDEYGVMPIAETNDLLLISEAEVFVPLRETAVEKGFEVIWQGADLPILVQKEGVAIEVTAGSEVYTVNGEERISVIPADLVEGVLYVSADVLA